jgi:hypothetical protein
MYSFLVAKRFIAAILEVWGSSPIMWDKITRLLLIKGRITKITLEVVKY